MANDQFIAENRKSTCLEIIDQEGRKRVIVFSKNKCGNRFCFRKSCTIIYVLDVDQYGVYKKKQINQLCSVHSKTNAKEIIYEFHQKNEVLHANFAYAHVTF